MTQYEKDLAYVKSKLKSVITPDDLGTAKRLKRGFIDKYSILISPTDLHFLKVISELDALEMEGTKKITSVYLFR